MLLFSIERISKINQPALYYRKVRSLKELANFKAIEYYMIFCYCRDIFRGVLSAQQMLVVDKLSAFLHKIMIPTQKDISVVNFLLEEVYQLLLLVEDHFGRVLITLTSHTVVHFLQ